MIAMLLLAAAAWSAPVTVPEGGTTWAAAVVPGWLEAEEDGDLGDVRLLDASGHEIPYQVLDAAQSDPNRWLTVAVTNLRRTADGFALSVEVPAGEVVDRLGLVVEGTEGVLAATVIGGSPPGALVDAVPLAGSRGRRGSRCRCRRPMLDGSRSGS